MTTVADVVGPLIADGRAEEAADVLLSAESRVGFLEVDIALVRLLQDVLEILPADEHTRRSRLAAKVAFELRGDASTGAERRAMLESAASEAEKAGDDVAATEALLATVHALWEPAGAAERLQAADRVIALARRTHNVEHELGGRLARVQALIEVSRVQDAEFEVATYARLAAVLDRPALRAFVASRRALLASIKGRYDEVLHQGDIAYTNALEAGMQDADRLLMVCRTLVDRDRGEDEEILLAALDMLRSLASDMPGHYFEANVARTLLALGRREQAQLELARALPSLLTSSGYRWLFSACEAAEVAAAVGSDDDCKRLYTALLPHHDRFVVLGPGFAGAVGDRLGVLATRLGHLEEALGHLRRTVADLDAIAGLPWAAWARVQLAAALRAAGDEPAADRELTAALDTARALGMSRLLAEVEQTPALNWTLRRDGDDWLLDTGREHGRFHEMRGFDHLHKLLANPHRDIAAHDLEAGDVPSEQGIPVLDQHALADYRRRLAFLTQEAEAADRAGDQRRAAALADERAQVLAELRRATGLGGRRRVTNDAGERARVNVTRNLKRALDQIHRKTPLAGAHLAASIRTGIHCRYEPAPGGPANWTLR